MIYYSLYVVHIKTGMQLGMVQSSFKHVEKAGLDLQG